MKAWIVWGHADRETSRIPSPGRIGSRVAVFLDRWEAAREAKEHGGEVIEGTVDHFASAAKTQTFCTGNSPFSGETRQYEGIVLVRGGKEATSMTKYKLTAKRTFFSIVVTVYVCLALSQGEVWK